MKFGDTRNNTCSANSLIYLPNCNGRSVTLLLLCSSSVALSYRRLSHHCSVHEVLARLRANMVRLTASPYLWTVAATGLYAGLTQSFAGAVMVKPKNDTSQGNLVQDGLEASQSRVNEHSSANNHNNKRSDHRVSSKG